MEYMNATKNEILNLVDFGSHPHGSHPHSSHPHGYRFSLLDTEIHGRTVAALWSVNKDRDNGYQRS